MGDRLSLVPAWFARAVADLPSTHRAEALAYAASLMAEDFAGSHLGRGSPWYVREDCAPWQENAIRAMEGD